jgi:hypothetical protein
VVDRALKDLLALLGYAQLQAFDRMAADARLAPDLARRATLSEMAAAELVGIADDFYGEMAAFLDEADRTLVLDVLHDDRYATFAAAEIRDAIAADPKVSNRLSMWGRRLVGEAMSQGMRVAEERPALVALIGVDTDVSALFARIKAAHTERTAAVGLNN